MNFSYPDHRGLPVVANQALPAEANLLCTPHTRALIEERIPPLVEQERKEASATLGQLHGGKRRGILGGLEAGPYVLGISRDLAVEQSHRLGD